MLAGPCELDVVRITCLLRSLRRHCRYRVPDSPKRSNSRVVVPFLLGSKPRTLAGSGDEITFHHVVERTRILHPNSSRVIQAKCHPLGQDVLTAPFPPAPEELYS